MLFLAVGVDESRVVEGFVDDCDHVAELENLKRMRQIRNAGHSRPKTFPEGIRAVAIRKILLLLHGRCWLIRDLVALNDSHTRGHPVFRAASLNVGGGRIEDLPYTLEIRLAVRRSWRRGSRRTLPGAGHAGKRNEYRDSRRGC